MYIIIGKPNPFDHMILAISHVLVQSLGFSCGFALFKNYFIGF